MKRRDVVTFARELATLMEAGLPAVPALQLIAEQRARKPMGPVVESLVDDLNAGLSLSQALARHPKVFDRFFVRTVATSDHGAPLIGALLQAADFVDAADTALDQAKKAMIYPLIVMALGMAVTLILLTVALPPMLELFNTLEGELPLPTKILIGASNALRGYPIFLLGSFASIVLTLWWYLRTPSGKERLHKTALNVPLLSRVIIENDVARISSALSALTNSGLGLPEALQVAADTASNEVIRSAILHARRRLVSGDGLAAPLAESGVFPTVFTQALLVGENTGTLVANFRRMAEYYKRESVATVKTFVGLIEPISTVIVAVLVGFIALAVVMPIYSALGSLN